MINYYTVLEVKGGFIADSSHIYINIAYFLSFIYGDTQTLNSAHSFGYNLHTRERNAKFFKSI